MMTPEYQEYLNCFWAEAKELIDESVSRRKWFDERFENVREKANRIHVREQLLAECWGLADVCD